MTPLVLLSTIIWVLACPLWLPSLPAPIRLIIAGACLVLVPACSWGLVWAGRRPHPAMHIACGVMAATVMTMVIAGGHAVAGSIPTAWTWWVSLGVLSAVGHLWAARLRAAGTRLPSATAVAVVCGVLALGGYAVFATSVVPAQPDHDFEVQASAYGLLTRAEPRMVTDRGLTWTFAHPPLLHVLVGGTFALTGTLPDLAIYDRLARDAPAAATMADAEQSLAVYQAAPHVVESRAVNVMLAALTVAVLAFWTIRRSGRWWMGMLAAGAYATSVEVVVRSSYGGYFAVTQLAVLLTLWMFERPGLHRRVAAAWGAWLLLIDHKAVLLPLSQLAAQWRRPAVRAFVAGATVGIGLFWAWGLWIAPDAFMADHVFSHLVDRIRHHNPLGYGGYPSVGELWWQFMRHGGPVVPCGLALVVMRPRLRAWVWWLAVMVVAFSVVDWRMTKHLMPLLVLAHVAVVPLRGDGRLWLRVSAGLLAVQWIWNGRLVATLIDSFEAIRVTPGW